MNKNVILNTNFDKLIKAKQGKVRDLYDLGEYYLMVSTDRLSAFDVILNQGIPFKGEVLTKISEFWFNYFKNDVENHIVTSNVDEYPEICSEYSEDLKGRSMLVKKAELIPIECIVRGYITGSGWKDYKNTGSLCGIKLPENLQESEKFETPLFTPSTKAEIGDHDENISAESAIDIVGEDVFNQIKNISLNTYIKAAEYAESKGIILADTKMEFGVYDGRVILIDELLTPDSSRFWPKDDYQVGRSQMSYDKQYVRDYLLSINFNKQPPAPNLPDEVITNTSNKYLDALNRLTEIKLDVS